MKQYYCIDCNIYMNKRNYERHFDLYPKHLIFKEKLSDIFLEKLNINNSAQNLSFWLLLFVVGKHFNFTLVESATAGFAIGLLWKPFFKC